MPTVRHFEELEIWQRARAITNHVYELTSKVGFRREFILREQARKSAVSIISNIAEGFKRGRPKEFRQFLRIAKGSSGELRAQIAIAADRGYVARAECQQITHKLKHLSRKISRLMDYLSTKA